LIPGNAGANLAEGMDVRLACLLRFVYFVKYSCHILRRNGILQQDIEVKIKGGIEVTSRRGRRRRKLLDDLKGRRGYSHLNEEALDRTMWRADFGRDFGPVVRQATKLIYGWSLIKKSSTGCVNLCMT
jgi:hypothetical protein